MIFVLLVTLVGIAVFFVINRQAILEGFGNDISDIPNGTYGPAGNQGQSANPLVPMDPGTGYYAINVGAVNAPIWKRKSVPYGYQRDPADLTKLTGKTEIAIATATGTLTDEQAMAPPFLNIPGETNPNFTPDKYSMTDISYNAQDTDRVYRDPAASKTEDANRGKHWMFDSEGKLMEVNTESNQSPILYYVPGAYKFGASNYVPNYEDSVYLSRTTRESQLAPIINTASQLGGFCTQYAGDTIKTEEKCAAQDLNTCASTSCCVLLGGQKCVAGGENGPKNVANYTDYNLKNRDFYYYQGKCYGNCP